MKKEGGGGEGGGGVRKRLQFENRLLGLSCLSDFMLLSAVIN